MIQYLSSGSSETCVLSINKNQLNQLQSAEEGGKEYSIKSSAVVDYETVLRDRWKKTPSALKNQDLNAQQLNGKTITISAKIVQKELPPKEQTDIKRTDSKRFFEGTSNFQSIQNLKDFWNNQIRKTKSSILNVSNSEQRSRPTTTKSAPTSPQSCNKSPLNHSFDDEKECHHYCPNQDASLFHMASDNFYKYKTAESCKRPNPIKGGEQLSEVIVRIQPLRQNPSSRLSCGDNKFPAVAATPCGEKIHWAKRDDIIINRKSCESKIFINVANEANAQEQQQNECPSINITTSGNNNEDSVMSHIENDSKISGTCAESGEMIDGNISSSNTNAAISQNLDDEPEKSSDLVDGNNDQLLNHKSSSENNTTKSLNVDTTTEGSKVATLAQLFNLLDKQDTAISDELKKNNKVQVYKIKNENSLPRKKSLSKQKRNDVDDGSNKTTKKSLSFKKKRSVSPFENSSLTKGNVRTAIGCFETHNKLLSIKLQSNANDDEADTLPTVLQTMQQRPTVPSKSEEILKRKEEINLKKRLRSNVQPSNETLVKIDISRIDANKKEEAKEHTETQDIDTEDLIENEENMENLEESSKKDILQESSTTNIDEKVPTNIDESIKEAMVTSEQIDVVQKIEEVTKKKSSRYSQIYERLRFRSPFGNKKSATTESRQDNSTGTAAPATIVLEPPSTKVTPSSIAVAPSSTIAAQPQTQPDQKIIDAIETIDKKLEHLSKSTNNLAEGTVENVRCQILPADIKPNESFLFRLNSKNMSLSTNHIPIEKEQTIIVEAINANLIKKKTQSLHENCLPTKLHFSQSDSTFDKRLQDSEKVYEEVFKDDENVTTSNTNPGELKQISFVHKLSTANTFSIDNDNDSISNYTECSNGNIYQKILKIKKLRLIKSGDSFSSYESYENYESVEGDELPSSKNGYEALSPPEPPPPRISNADNTSELKERQVVARKLSNSNSEKDNQNQSAEAVQIPPDQPPHRKESLRSRDQLPEIPVEIPAPPSEANERLYFCNQIYAKENTYDTIKNSETPSHCYESIPSKTIREHLDSISMSSNVYESINCYRHISGIQHSDSISILSSDQKTNSMYGVALDQNKAPSDHVASDNSDEWVDVSEEEEDTRKDLMNHHLSAVVQENTACERTGTNSKTKDDDNNAQPSDYAYEDDSDHYYEPLYVKSLAEQNIPTTSTECNTQKVGNADAVTSDDGPQTSAYYSDEFDSFESDDEFDEDIKKSNNELDIQNAKLPDPPAATSQVYAFVKKIRNLGSLSKSLSRISKGKHSSGSTSTSKHKSKSPPSKPYENTVFYVNEDLQQTHTSKSNKSKKSQNLKKSQTKKGDLLSPSDHYENTEFHSPPSPLNLIPLPANANSSPSPTSAYKIFATNNERTSIDNSNDSSLLDRKKTQSGKSFKSKLRKSLDELDTKPSTAHMTNGSRSTFYVIDTPDNDSGIFAKELLSDTSVAEGLNETPTSQNKLFSTLRKSKKSISSPDLSRRRTVFSGRPPNPPPPPPNIKKPQRPTTTTFWYAECGVFKTSVDDENVNNLKNGRGEKNGSTSWYTEVGLYQTSGASVVSSSGSSGVSAGDDFDDGTENSHSMFENEPLYQIYSAAKQDSIIESQSLLKDVEEQDGYEEINSRSKTNEERKKSRPSALQLVDPKKGPSKTLWSEIQEVMSSEILRTLTPREKRVQEAKFEILTSEASYLKSLNLLKTHFMNCPALRDTSILSSSDRKALFSHILPVQECSEKLLSDLERCWQDNIMLLGLSEYIYEHAEKNFHVYISFCEHQGKMDRTVRRLKEAKGAFNQTLESLESDPIVCGLTLYSFLMLPMQRITRLPLLIDAVLSKLDSDNDEYENWKMTLAILNKTVIECNEAAKRCDQAYEIEKISRQLEFPSNIRSLAIAPVGVPALGKKPRTLVRKGELTHLVWRGDDGKLTFGRKFTKFNIYAFLFTDLLVLTKKKGDDQFVVFDYCPRSMLEISTNEFAHLPIKDANQAGKYLILMTLLENHETKTVEMILACPSESEQQRWLEVTAPPTSENPDEKIYEDWNCPQVVAKAPYSATEPDLLNLEPGDTINVTRKTADGWYQGERIRDGAKGWFPSTYTEEVNSEHVRARNLKQRNRFLIYTANYVELHMKRKTTG